VQNLRPFLIYSVIGTISLMPLLVLPAMIGVLVDETSLTESQAGWSASLNFLGGALVAFVLALRMHRLDLRKAAAVGFLLAAAGDTLSGFSADQPGLFLAIRLITGIGAGAAYTTSLAAFARLPDVDRGYAIFVTLQFIVSGLGLFLLPVFSSTLGTTGMFLSLAGLNLVGLVLTRYMPGPAMDKGHRSIARSELHVLLAWATIIGALGFLVFEAANTAQFTYVERLGVSLAFSDHQVGSAMMIASLAGIPGAFSIVLLGRRIGRMAGLSLGIAVSITGLVIMIQATRFVPYLIGSIMISFSWAFCLPYIQGLLATLDRHGSAVAAGSASSTVGGAIGPGLAAMVIGGSEYKAVFAFSIGLLLTALLAFFISGRHAAADIASGA
jgi:predicted MFS family arabinose efflux permease